MLWLSLVWFVSEFVWCCGLACESWLFGGSLGVIGGLTSSGEWGGGPAGGWGDNVGIGCSPVTPGSLGGAEWGFGNGDGAADWGEPTDGTVRDSWVRGYDGGPPCGVHEPPPVGWYLRIKINI